MAEWSGSCRVGRQATGLNAYRLWPVMKPNRTYSSREMPPNGSIFPADFRQNPCTIFFCLRYSKS